MLIDITVVSAEFREGVENNFREQNICFAAGRSFFCLFFGRGSIAGCTSLELPINKAWWSVALSSYAIVYGDCNGKANWKAAAA